VSGGLSRKITFLFLAVVLPVSAAHWIAFWMIDRTMQAALQKDTATAFRAIERFVEAQPTAVARAAERLGRALDGAPIDCEGVTAGILASTPFEMAAVVRLSSPPRVACSKHIPAALGLPAEAFELRPGRGLAVPLAPGNPPRPVAAWVAVARFEDSSRAPATVWVGRRIDDGRLDAFTAMAGGGWRLASSSEDPGPSPAPGLRTRTFRVGSLTGEPASLNVWVSPGPWPSARRRLVEVETLLVTSALLFALVVALAFSRAVSRPLLELSQAAGRVADGDLSARVDIRRTDELGRLALDFNDMTEQLGAAQDRIKRAERRAAWREAAQRVAHEVKNPLFPIRVAVETMHKAVQREHPDLQQIARTSTDTVLDAVRSIDRLVAEFSDFARLPSPSLAPVPVADLLERVVQLYRPAHPRIDLQVVAPPPLTWTLDGEMMTRALGNLVKNAIEALDAAPGRVVVGAQSDGTALVLTVDDDGPGIDDAIRDRVFEPYVSRRSGGSGLGLAVVDRIVDTHGGQLEAHSPGPISGGPQRPGTRIVLRLPPAAPDPPTSA
jgi:signal transduction histidine kinase